jgi:predicted enzyme related to lactoylglutathione lyase
MMPPMDVMEFGRMAMAADPTGAVFGLWQAGTHSGAQVVNEPVSLVWNELTTPDAEKASRFYGEVLGHTTATVPESDDEGGMLQVGDRPVANVNETTDAPPGWGVYFNVADADATVSRAEELGATVVSPGADTPWGRMATLEDPQGARFSVIAGETG